MSAHLKIARTALLACALGVSFAAQASAASIPGETTLKSAGASSLGALQAGAEAGDAEAQYQIGMIHNLGELAPLDKAEAARWFALAAAQNHAGAQVSLGYLYVEGEGVERNR